METFNADFQSYLKAIEGISTYRTEAKIRDVVGNLIIAYNPGLQVSDLCRIYNDENEQGQLAEVVGFRGENVFIMPLGDIRGIGPHSKIIKDEGGPSVLVGEELLGRVIDGMGNALDGKGPISSNESKNIYQTVINPLLRRRILEPLDVGIRVINGLMTIGKGQRIGILAGSGVGKSVLLGMMARNTTAEVNVIGLIGERGREVKEFIEKDLGEEGLRKSVVIAATSDQSPLVRMRGAFIAMTIAEYFREMGKDVLLTMDSITRFAMAQREIGLSVGEPPTTKGYPPSVFSLLPKLLERAGNSDSKGTLTGIFTVLIEGDDMNEPIGDAVRSIVDGHIVLDRKIAARGRYPAIDILNSKSRTMVDVVPPKTVQNAALLTETFSIHNDAEDLINIGAYVEGANPKIDYSISKIEEINNFLKQGMNEKCSLEQSFVQAEKIFRDKTSPGPKDSENQASSKTSLSGIGRLKETKQSE